MRKDVDLQKREYAISFIKEIFCGCKIKFVLKTLISAFIVFAVLHPVFLEGFLPLHSLKSVVRILLVTGFSIFLCGVLCYTVFKFEKLLKIFCEAKRKAGLSSAVFFTTITAMLFKPMSLVKNQVTDFDRVIGMACVYNVDVSKRILNFNSWYILFAVYFVLFYLFFNAFYQENKSEETECRVKRIFRDFMTIANCALLTWCISYFQGGFSFSGASLSLCFVLFVVIGLLAYSFFKIYRYISLNRLVSLAVIGFSIVYSLLLAFALNWGVVGLTAKIFICFAVAIIFFVKFFEKHSRSLQLDTMLHIGMLVFSFIPLAISFYIEFMHILNQWNVFNIHYTRLYHAMLLAILLIWFFVAFVCRNKNLTIVSLKRIAYPVFVFGIVCLCNQVPLFATYNPDLFEGANAGILISDFLHFASVPIVEHYGGHMMTGVWEGILYALLNRDFDGAFVSPYMFLLVSFVCLMFFYAIKHFWNEDMAFFATLLFPFYAAWSYYGMGMLVSLAAINYIRMKTFFRAFLLWGSFVWCAFYRLDMGFAYGVALVASVTVYCIVLKDKNASKQLFLTLVYWMLALLFAWCVLCAIKHINPVNRLFEFLEASLSNRNWAYPWLGDASKMLFAWSYIIVPFSVVIGLLYIIFSRELRNKIGLEKWLLLQIFGWCYFANFSRGLVRHSLVEIATAVVIWCGYLFLAMVISCYKNNLKLFLPSFLILIILNGLLINGNNFVQRPVFDNVLARPLSVVRSWQGSGIDEKVVQRVRLQDGLKEYADKYLVLNELLEKNETFADFTNKTLLYCVLSKKCPVYVSQSPLQLSGEFMQEEFVEQIKGCPIVLMPANTDYRASQSLDGISNPYRYYKVAEYIYQNYIPLYKCGEDYTVWCFPEKYDDYAIKIGSFVENGNLEYIFHGYDDPIECVNDGGAMSYEYIGNNHSYSLNHLPRIWAAYDEKKSADNAVLQQLRSVNEVFLIDNQFSGQETGSYLKISATYSGNDEYLEGVVVLGEYQNTKFKEKYRYKLIFRKGCHNYIIRCSTDYHWYTDMVNAVQIRPNDILRDIEVNLLEGD